MSENSKPELNKVFNKGAGNLDIEGLLNNHIAEILTFVCGMIVSIVLFAITQTSVERVVSEEYTKVTDGIGYFVSDAIEDIFLVTELAGETILADWNRGYSYVSESIKNNKLLISESSVQAIYVLDNRYTRNQNVNLLYINKKLMLENRFPEDRLSKYVSDIIKSENVTPNFMSGDTPVISPYVYEENIYGDSFKEKSFREATKYSFSVLKFFPGSANSDRGFFILVFVDGKNLLDGLWFNYQNTDTALRLFHKENIIYEYFGDEYDKTDHGYNSSKGNLYSKTYLVSPEYIPQTNLVVSLSSLKNYGFFESFPLGLFLLGSLLSVVGAQYVNSNRRYSKKLFKMNVALRKKNSELNSQVAEREKLNKILRKSEKDNKAIIDSINDIIFELNKDGEIVFLNRNWQKVTGFEIERSYGRNMFEVFFHPKEKDEQKDKFLMAVSNGETYGSYARIRTDNGVFRSVEMSISMIRNDTDYGLRIVGTMTDIEDRRKTEKALIEAERKYRSIIENIAGGIYQVTPEGQYLSINPAMVKIFGYESVEEMLRLIRDANAQLYVDVRQRRQFLDNVSLKDGTFNCEIQSYRKDGSIIWISESTRAVKDDDGNTLFFEGSIEDITKRKEVEIELRSAKIESDLSNRAKSEFLANMSHELRTPLNAIIGFSEIIKNEAFGPVGQQPYIEYATDIHTGGTRLLKVINDILDVAKIDANERQLNESIVDLDKVIAGSLEFLEKKLEETNLTVTVNTENIPKLVGEEVAIKQIFTNILSNAVKFTPSGGRVTLAYELEPEGQLRISVTDTGVGLNEDEIKKALSPFGQVETSLNRSGSGTGLGLTLVDSLMKLHGGNLEFFSQKGIGTTVNLIFPAKRVAKKD